MELILKRDLPQLGFTGDRVSVKNGYARNFLIPEGYAVEINKRNEKYIRNQIQFIESQKAKLKDTAVELGEKIKSESYELKLKVGEKGKSFGSITARDIHALVLSKGIEIDRNQVILPEPIKFVGDFIFKVKLHSEVIEEVPLTVIAEKVKKAAKKKAKAEDENAEDQEQAPSEDAPASEEGEADDQSDSSDEESSEESEEKAPGEEE